MLNELSSNGGRLMDLSGAVVITPSRLGKRERNSLGMLLDEVKKRSGIRWKMSHQCPPLNYPLNRRKFPWNKRTCASNGVN